MIDQQSTKSPPQHHQQSINNPSQDHQQSIKIEAWKGSGRILAPRRVLGGVPGGSWAILVAQMAPTGVPRWLQVGAQIAQKSMPTSLEFLMPLKIEAWMEKIDFLIGRCCFLDLIWDEILIICTFRNERDESQKTTIFIVPEGLSRPSEDCNIE